MAIRLRRFGDDLVALCAAETQAKYGDIYLNDTIHHALTAKFSRDFNLEGWTEKGERIPESEIYNRINARTIGRVSL